MLHVLKDPIFARLFSAQVIALLGTGLLTVALGLLAFNLAGDKAGVVLGTAFAIKMIAYIGLAPVANAIGGRLPRKTVLIGADLVRASVAVFLPFIDSVWQIYLLIFILQAASATFTPSFQALIPDILPDERDYTNALSLSRLAYDLENLVSPALAGVLLTLMSFHWLFGGTVVGFAVSAALLATTHIPAHKTDVKVRAFSDRLTRGVRIYLSTPRLRGLLALNLAAAAAGAFILVNTVVIVRAEYGATDTHVAYAFAVFGGGSMFAALTLPRILQSYPDRGLMISAAFILSVLTIFSGLFSMSVDLPTWGAFLSVWATTGVLYSAILTPSGRLLRRSAHPEDRPSVFTAQFALSHACWLLSYPVAGWAGEILGLPMTMMVLGLIALAGSITALFIWPSADESRFTHAHPDLPPDHPHLREHQGKAGRHRHEFVIDDEHRVWPTSG
jgi:MFS family permease